MKLTDLRRFVGNPAVYAEQQSDGSYRPVRAPLDDAVLRAHIARTTTVGTYVVNLDKARFMVFDVDDDDRALAGSLLEEAKQRGLNGGICLSGRKGYHVWVLFRSWHSAADVQALAKDIAQEVGFTGEVFPKQQVARNLGNLVKLPFGEHKVTGQRSRFITTLPSLNTDAVFEAGVRALPMRENPNAPSTTALKGVLPCLDSIQNDPPQPGQRNILAFHFACHLRRAGLHDAAVEAALATVVKQDELDPGEFENIVENSKYSGPICDQLPADRHCGEHCVKTRSTSALSQRPGQLRNAVEGEPVVLLAGKRLPGDAVVPLEHPDADVVKAALRSDGD